MSAALLEQFTSDAWMKNSNESHSGNHTHYSINQWVGHIFHCHCALALIVWHWIEYVRLLTDSESIRFTAAILLQIYILW